VPQTESHRLIEHLMIAANEQVARLLDERGVPALYRVHERPEPERVERLVDQLASLGVPTPPVPRTCPPLSRRAELIGAGDLAVRVEHRTCRSRGTGRGGRGADSLVLRRSSRPTTPPQPRSRRAPGHGATATSPRRSAATRTSSAIARCCRRSGGGERPRPIGRAGRAGRSGPPTASARRCRSSATPTTWRAASLLERLLYEAGLGASVFAGEVVGLIGAGAFVAVRRR
jgi:ribonuclease R